MVVEIIGGYIAGSLAIMTDAAHLLTDIAAMALSLIAMRLGRRRATETMSFGYQRAEILGALASVVTIWVLVLAIAFEALVRLVQFAQGRGEAVDAVIVTVVGALGLAVNIVDAVILHWGKAGHSHSHGGGAHSHSHGSSAPVAEGDTALAVPGDSERAEPAAPTPQRAAENVNLRATFLHVLGDCFQSVGVIAAGLVIWLGNASRYGTPTKRGSRFNAADPIASLLFGAVTVWTTVGLTRGLLRVLMQSTPEGVDVAALRGRVCAIEGVESVHHLHVWSHTLEAAHLSAHIVAAGSEHPRILRLAAAECARQGIRHTTIQMDEANCELTLDATHLCL
eukprot:c5943_g1_i2.p1 GENE.c5943_g1_i2~~c5943_g1_i2.p1  ORF type:complete len:338 (-),score=48.27 c5943_g1_i2:23-1036(-)